MSALGALLGAAMAAGLLLVVTGLVSTAARAPRGRPRSLPPQLWGRVALGVVGAGVAGAVTGWPVAAAGGAVAGWYGPRMLGASARGRRAATDRVQALATWAEMLRDGFAAGSLLSSTIAATETVAPLPIRGEVGRLCAGMRRARPGAVEAALRRLAAEVADPTADLVVTALLLAVRGSGANLAELLSTLATSDRGEVSMRLRIEAARAEGCSARWW